MRPVRWLLVFLFYVAAELMSPAAAAPFEGLDGEAEESIHLSGQRRLPRLAVARRRPEAAVAHAAQVRSERLRAFRSMARARSNPLREARPPVADSASAPAPEDH
jgi:hypothetical protein